MSEIPTDAITTNGASAEAETGPSEERLRLGGMALRNGLLIHGPTSWSVAARNRDGEIDVATGPKPNFGGNRVSSVPLLRGPIRLAEAFAVIPIARLRLRSSRLPFEDPRVVVAGAVATIGSSALRPADGEPALLRELGTSLLGMLPALVALSGTELAAYHGVEHKAIAAYEQGGMDPSETAKEHQRCGSNLIAPMMVFGGLAQLLVDRLVEKPGPVARGVASVAGLSLSVETFAFAERRPQSTLGRLVHGLGDGIQRLFATREPDERQLEVGVAALDAVLAAEGAE